jgi:hypothetical protein
MKRSRRTFLQAAALVGSLGIAGCNNGGDDSTQTPGGGNGNGNGNNGGGTATGTANNSTSVNGTTTPTETDTETPTEGLVGSNERWDMLQADGPNTGHVPLNHEVFGGAERSWSVQLNGQAGLQPAFDEERVYVPTRTHMYAVDRASQEVLWSFEAPEGPVTTPVLPGDGFVYFVTGDGVHKLETEEGWDAFDYAFNETIDDFRSVVAPSAATLVGDSMLFNVVVRRASGQLSRVVRVSLRGERQWARWVPARSGLEATTPASGFAPTPAVNGSNVSVTVGWDKQDATLYSMNAGGGVNWQKDYTGKGWSSVSAARGHLFFADRYADVFQSNGVKVVRRTLNPPPNAYACAVGPENVFMSSRVYEGNEGTLYAVNDSGRVQWRFEGEGNLFAPTVTDDTVYVASASGYLFGLDRNDGLADWKQDLGTSGKTVASGPAVSTDEVYVVAGGTSEDAKLVAVSLTE